MKIRLVVAVIVVLGGCGAESSPPAADSAPRTDGSVTPDAPKEVRSYAAPDFTVTTFEGEKFRLGVHEGTPVVLNFWESW